MRTKPRLATISGLYTSSALEIGDGWVCRRVGTGTYTLSFRLGFRPLSVVATSKGSIRVVSVNNVAPTPGGGANAAVVSYITNSAALDDQGLYFVATGWDSGT